MLRDLLVVHRNNCSLNFLIECNNFPSLVLGTDPQKILVIGSVPTTVNASEVSNLFVHIVHLFLNLCDF